MQKSAPVRRTSASIGKTLPPSRCMLASMVKSLVPVSQSLWSLPPPLLPIEKELTSVIEMLRSIGEAPRSIMRMPASMEQELAPTEQNFASGVKVGVGALALSAGWTIPERAMYVSAPNSHHPYLYNRKSGSRRKSQNL